MKSEPRTRLSLRFGLGLRAEPEPLVLCSLGVLGVLAVKSGSERQRFIPLWTAATLLALAAPAWAVIPGLAGPLQALGQMLPQILPFFAAGFAALLSSRA